MLAADVGAGCADDMAKIIAQQHAWLGLARDFMSVESKAQTVR